MTKKNYHIFERLRFATCLTFISGFLNAFTFITQGGRFAGVQSGNVVYLAYYVANRNMKEAVAFLIPILFFVFGQWFTYLLKRFCIVHSIPWHLTSTLVMMGLVILDILLNPLVGHSFTIAVLAFVASIQVETFRNIHGLPYANVMMIGNVKNAAFLWFKGIIEKNAQLTRRRIHIFYAILTFMLGVVVATFSTQTFKEQALIVVLLPLIYMNVQLWLEKKLSNR
ncbi:DUF1275 domain-containing protein [Streptococcus sp. X16XC17]|uniref:YoaK family protein n=1 Tax=unclassified Streptococcus TaxID=2608887 RepID=UPI00066FF903|nr:MULTISPECIES: YoaK family protein [unclassified Streptococcus]TCD45479.1 DUF1275 domain-containing protein [Streptococcus sp. X16XC17]